jgi:hypothetical protein
MVVLDSALTGGASSHLARWLLDRQVAAIGDETEAALEAIPATEGVAAGGVSCPDPRPGAGTAHRRADPTKLCTRVAWALPSDSR